MTAGQDFLVANCALADDLNDLCFGAEWSDQNLKQAEFAAATSPATEREIVPTDFGAPAVFLDNGLEVGVRFELEGEQQGGDQMDETYAYIEGSFGTFRVGNDDPVIVSMATAAPYLNYVFGANSPTVFTNGLSQFYAATGRAAAGAGYATFATFAGMTGDDAQLMYFTPVFNGFQFGISYAPDQGEARTGGGYGLGTRTGAGSALAEEYSIAGRYDGEVGDLGVTVALGFLEASGRTVTSTVQAADMQAWMPAWCCTMATGASVVRTSTSKTCAASTARISGPTTWALPIGRTVPGRPVSTGCMPRPSTLPAPWVPRLVRLPLPVVQ